MTLKVFLFIMLNEHIFTTGVVISKSAAAKLTSFKTEKISFSVNTNDVLLNLYGSQYEYKGFPHIGDKVDSKVLVASRRRDKRTSLYDFQADHLREIEPDSDELIYTHGGTVVDINVYNNIPLAELRKKTDAFNKEVLEVVENQYNYWKTMADELEKIIPVKILTESEKEQEEAEYGISIKHPLEREKNPNKYTDELSYYWKLAHENIDERIQWRSDGKSFENFKMEFIILKENPLTPGCKLTGRYGNKGVISIIEDDEKMPLTKDGVRADVCLNSLGVINRCNPGQIIEQHINFMSDHIIKQLKQIDYLPDKEDLFLTYLKALNEEEYNYFSLQFTTMNRADMEEFFEDIETNGIYIHQPPIFGNTTTEQFEKILKEHPDWVEPYEFYGIEKPLVMGDMYFIRLKHESRQQEQYEICIKS